MRATFSLFLILLSAAMPAADQTISGDPLRITASDDMRMQVFRLQSDGQGGFASVRQYYSTYAPYLSLSTAADGAAMYTPETGTFTAGTNSMPDPWTIETIAGAADGVVISQTVSYVDGTQVYRHAWTIANGGSTVYTAASFRYGGDTYFSGSDSANGFFSAGLGMVYCSNSAFAGVMGMYGGEESPASHHIEGPYGTVLNLLRTPGTPLPDGSDGSYKDNGMGLEWSRGRFAPGDSFTIVAYEKWTDAGLVQVLAPRQTTAAVGNRLALGFTVLNLRSVPDTVSFAATASTGLVATVPGAVAVPANSERVVVVPVDIGLLALSTTGTVELAATSGADGTVTRDATPLVVGPTLPVLGVALPPIPRSMRDQTVFTALSCATARGAAQLLQALGRQDGTRAVGYAWDAAAQAYVRLPDEPAGGLSPSSGIFIAARVDPGLDLSGAPAPVPADIVLVPGWNFCGVPLLYEGGSVYADHAFPGDFQVFDHLGAEITDPGQFVDTLGTVGSGDPATARPWAYVDGAYVQVDALATGRGYWLKNNAAEVVTLRRIGASRAQAAGSRAVARRGTYHDRGAPPTAPAASSDGGGDGGGCGAGSGIAGLLAFGWLVLRRRVA